MWKRRRFSLPILGCVCVAIAGGGTVFAAEPLLSPQIDAAMVKALLNRIESSQASERATAAKELQALGTGILPFLPPPDRMETAAGRDVVVQIRHVLERQLATESARASVVSLNTTASPIDLIANISRQTGNRIALADNEIDAPIAVDWKARSFWEAVDDVLVKSKHRIEWNATAGQFLIEHRIAGAPLPVIAHAGPFRAEATLGKLKTAQNTGDQTVFRVHTVWQAEPRLRPLFLRVKAGDWHGVTANGTVTPWNPDAEYELPIADGTRQVSWPLDLLWPMDEKGEKWSLHGKAVVHLAAMTETIGFDAVALRPNVQRRRGGVAVRIRAAEFRPGDDGRLSATIRILVAYDTGGPAFESHRTWVFYQGANLLGPKDQRIAFTDYEATQEVDGAVGIEYRFHNLPGRGSDYRFQYEAPTLFLDVPLDVSFRDLPAPE